MIQNIETRYLTLEDLPQIVRVENGAWEPELRASEDTIKKRFGENPGGFIGHFEDGVLQGFVYFRRVQEYRHFRQWVEASQAPLILDGKFVYVVNVSVYPKGEGHGQRMLGNVAQMLRSDGIEEIALGSREETEHFYKRCNFEVYERISGWWPEDTASAGKGILMKNELIKRYR